MKIVADIHLPLAEEAFGPLGRLTLLETSELSAAAVREADALVVRSVTGVGPALLEGSRVRFVGTASIGVDHLDVSWLDAHGISWASAPGCNSRSVMEYVVAALLETGRRIGSSWSGRTIGVVGVGAVGGKVARAAEALGMRVLLNDPPLARCTRDPKYVSLDALMEADVLTLHVPLTKDGPDPTFHLFDAARFAKLKPRPLFINSSRGAVVGTAALREALDAGWVRAAVLDVWEGEPTIDAGLAERALIGTAHVAGYSLEGKINAVAQVRDALARHIGIDPDGLPVLEAPPAGFPPIAIADAAGSDEDILRLAVSETYDIALDDRLLRESLTIPSAERPRAFARLRTGYRVRREFGTRTVVFSDERGTARSVLSALGFTVVSRR